MCVCKREGREGVCMPEIVIEVEGGRYGGRYIWRESCIMCVVLQASLITVCGSNMMHKWCLEQQEGDTAPELVLDRSYKFQGGL